MAIRRAGRCLNVWYHMFWDCKEIGGPSNGQQLATAAALAEILSNLATSNSFCCCTSEWYKEPHGRIYRFHAQHLLSRWEWFKVSRHKLGIQVFEYYKMWSMISLRDDRYSFTTHSKQLGRFLRSKYQSFSTTCFIGMLPHASCSQEQETMPMATGAKSWWPACSLWSDLCGQRHNIGFAGTWKCVEIPKNPREIEIFSTSDYGWE